MLKRVRKFCCYRFEMQFQLKCGNGVGKAKIPRRSTKHIYLGHCKVPIGLLLRESFQLNLLIKDNSFNFSPNLNQFYYSFLFVVVSKIADYILGKVAFFRF